MMLSKTTCYAFFVVLCLVISVSDGTYDLVTAPCNDDEAFLRSAQEYQQRNVPILVTKNEYKQIEDNIIHFYRSKTFIRTFIIVYVDNDKCPATVEFLNTGNNFPTLYMMKKDRLFNDKFCANHSNLIDIEAFHRAASSWTIPQETPFVTYSMQMRINERKRRLAEQAVITTAALNSAVGQASSTGYSMGDSSRKGPISRSPSPPTFLDDPQTLDLFRTSQPKAEDDPNLGLATFNYDPKDKRKASPPLNDSFQRRRMSGEHNQQTPPQDARSSQDIEEMGSFLSKAFKTPSPPR